MKTMRVVAAVLAAAAGTTFLAAPAVAQTTKKQKEEVRIDPPTQRKADKPPVIWNYVVAFIIVGAAFGANLIPSKRGHQD